jgi:hypothetical protein
MSRMTAPVGEVMTPITRLHAFDDDLVFRAAGVGCQLAGDDHLQAIFGAERKLGGDAFPHDAIDDGIGILQCQIDMAGGGALEAGNLPAHADMAILVLHRALERMGEFADRIFGGVGKYGIHTP